MQKYVSLEQPLLAADWQHQQATPTSNANSLAVPNRY